ncbi:MAG TPA: N-acetylmuramoyl-L-alanine amidase, partial [Verrucomicrobiota bacterium]|nr:N-acetylmuramoyl-L-alanine amidase [Verrucomicrobiota bacterium]
MKPTSLKPLLTLILALLFLGAASLPALELSGRKVVIDPGHGGSDPGATGYDGPGKPNEADFNLAVSLKLRTLLQAAGCSVVMTRSTDVAVDL